MSSSEFCGTFAEREFISCDVVAVDSLPWPEGAKKFEYSGQPQCESLLPPNRGEGVQTRFYLPVCLVMRGTRRGLADPAARQTRFLHLSHAGFSLMEVLVGIAILGIVYATLFSLMSGSLKNVSRIDEREKVVQYGQTKLNELVIRARLGELKQVLAGRFDEKYSWQARLEVFDTGGENVEDLPYFVARIRLSVLWSNQSRSNQYDLETLTWVPKPKEAA
jgi:prepilin-type N-terminal cleavage/methylation domain-containing protein